MAEAHQQETSSRSSKNKWTVSLVVAGCCWIMVLLVACTCRPSLPPTPTQPFTTTPQPEHPLPVPVPSLPITTVEEDRSLRLVLASTPEEEEAMLAQIRMKLQPNALRVDSSSSYSSATAETKKLVLEPHQFLHLHHMKTGGTSIDHLIQCAMDRLERDFGYQVPYHNIHECSRSKFAACVANETDPCREPMQQAAAMSYCAALKHLEEFGWEKKKKNTMNNNNDAENNQDFKAFTVLRHPVDRVWSMYRFETKKCYKCRNLTDIYDSIDRGETEGLDNLCMAQVQNHETANLLSSTSLAVPINSKGDAEENARMVAEAIENMKSFFTLIGLTEELTTSTQMLGTVFPWLNKTMEGSKRRCGLTHANSSPKNNFCQETHREDGTVLLSHRELPSHPDEETRKAIEAHNQLDLQLYEAAVQYFALQKRAWEENIEAASRRRQLETKNGDGMDAESE